MTAGVHMPWFTYRGRTTHNSCFSPSNIRVPGIELRSLDWAESTISKQTTTTEPPPLEIFAVVEHSKVNTEDNREERVCWSGLVTGG